VALRSAVLLLATITIIGGIISPNATQAQDYTYNYTSMQLQGGCYPPLTPPTNLYLTATATIDSNGVGYATLSFYGLSATVPINQGQNAGANNFVAVDGRVIYSGLAANFADNIGYVMLWEMYQPPYFYEDVAWQYMGGFAVYCGYQAINDSGLWTGPIATLPSKTLGDSSPPTETENLPSSPVNPTTDAPTTPIPNCNCGDPINTATGNVFETEHDFIGSLNTGLSLTRYYNSGDPTSSAFGPNWHSTWHRGLTVDASGNVTVTRADGYRYVFTKNNGVYTADPDVTSTLTATVNSGAVSGYRLVTSDDAVEIYSSTGLLLSVTSRAVAYPAVPGAPRCGMRA